MDASKQLIVVTGPTAVGKTGLSIRLAQAIGTEIISADARQCYKYMDIGTAKPTVSECGQVKHHLIDFLPLENTYSAGAFAADALGLLKKLWQGCDRVVVTGGSGLYVRALCEGLADMPAVPRHIYGYWEGVWQEKGLGFLLQSLQKHDPSYYSQVDVHNPHRIIRALAVHEVSGKPYSYFRDQKIKKRDFEVIKIGLTLPREVLYQRIDDRVDEMVAQGLFEEARSLHPYSQLPALQTAIGYQEIFSYLEGDTTKQEAIDLIKRHTRNYAKRQLTWFKKDKHTKWFAPTDLTTIKAFVNVT
ncbi:MAG: tRNA (adenosine(37)-N6)-dimethylallyltransferase MiaA [Bacteroidota bacterium]